MKRARLPAPMPASRVFKKPGDNERQEGKDAVSSQKKKDGNHETGDKLEGDHLPLEEDHSA